jgi:hypothetical protein
MPQHIRIAVERAFATSEIRVLACTTTLMQGVNLPAKNIIARNPNLFINRKANSTSLTAYEFANLRGRAGRLLKDFVGRAIILDETAFDQAELDFGSPEKQVTAGYRDRFDRDREQVISDLTRGAPAPDAADNADLLVYIRQRVLRFGEAALAKLAAAGIVISDEELSRVRRQLLPLEIPTAVVSRAPYWDPLVLEQLYQSHRRGRIPRIPASPYAPDFAGTLARLLSELKEIVPFYYERYLGNTTSPVIQSIVSMAQQWATGASLRKIISWEGPAARLDWEEVDRRIVRLNTTVVYNLPKLLRPVIAMQAPDNPIASFIELGAYRPETRRIIELGVPRETAVRIGLDHRFASVDLTSDDALLRSARSIAERLNYWERDQLSLLTPEAESHT